MSTTLLWGGINCKNVRIIKKTLLRCSNQQKTLRHYYVVTLDVRAQCSVMMMNGSYQSVFLGWLGGYSHRNYDKIIFYILLSEDIF